MSRWVNSGTIVGLGVTVVGWLIGQLLDLPLLVVLLIGLVAWVLALNGFVTLGRRSHNRMVAAVTGGKGILRVPTSESFDQLREEVQEVKAERRQSERDLEELRAKNEELKAEAERLRGQPSGKGLRRDWLKRDCRDMAAYLRWFLKDHEQETEDQVLTLYRERYQDKVNVLLQQLEQQGLYPPEYLQSFEVAADKYPRSPMAIDRLAGTLGSIGHEI